MAVHSKNAVDVSNLSAFINKYGSQILSRAVNGADFLKDVTVDRKVKSEKKYPKIVFKNGMKPYTGEFDPEPNKIVLSDRGIKVGVAQDDYIIDPEIFRGTFLEDTADISGRQIPIIQTIIQGIADDIMATYNDKTLFFGDTASTDKALKVHDGFRKQIRTLRTTAGSGIIIVPTGTLTKGSGWGPTATFGNITDSIFKVYRGLSQAVRNKKICYAYCSEKTFDLYAEDYRRKHGIEIGGQGDPRDQEIVYLDGSKKKCIIKWVTWMGDSDMIICTPKENMVFGTDIEDVQNSKLNAIPDVHVTKMGWKLVAGVCIPDPEAMSVNELDAAQA